MENNLNYLKGFLIFLSAWFFGFQNIITAALGYFSYHNGNSKIILTFLFMLSWFLYGLLSSLYNVFIVLLVALVMRKDSIKKFIEQTKNFIKLMNLAEQMGDKPDDAPMSAQYVKLILDKYTNIRNKLIQLTTNNIVYQYIVTYYQKFTTLIKNYDLRKYLQILDTTIKFVTQNTLTLLSNMPYIKPMINVTKINPKLDHAQSEIIKESLTKQPLLKSVSEPIIKPKDMDNLDAFLKSTNSFPKDFKLENIPPPSKEDIEQLSKMLGALGGLDLNKMMGDLKNTVPTN